MLILQGILTGKENTQEINRIDQHLYTLAKPKEYTGQKGAEVTYVKNYEEMTLVLTRYMGKDAKRATVREYYQAFIALKKENKRRQKKNSK